MAAVERAVLVTGTSSGVGEACVQALAQSGYRVFAAVRREEDARRWAQTAQVQPLRFDVRDEQEVTRAFAELTEQLRGSGLHGLVNSAGVGFNAPLEHTRTDELRDLFEVNVFGRMTVTRAALPLLRQARGRIVNIGSVNGVLAAPFVGAYSASMHAIEALNDSLRLELAPCGVSVSLCELPPVNTPVFDKGARQFEAKWKELGDEGRERYGKRYRALVDSAMRWRERATPMERVTWCVLHAMSARRPRTRYAVGTLAKVGLWAVRVSSDAMLDRWRLAGLSSGESR